MKHASKTIGFHNFSVAGALKQFVFSRVSLAEQLQLMKPNGLAAPANENFIKTCFCRSGCKKPTEGIVAALCSVCFIQCFTHVSYMFHTSMLFCEHILGGMNLGSCTGI